tara:strand:- start:22494 stop:23285 length:792 start_codon:yes stop_codon:yes gene_type:complete
MDIINYFIEMSPRSVALLGFLFVGLGAIIISFVKSKLFQEFLTGTFDWVSEKRGKNKLLESSTTDLSNLSNSSESLVVSPSISIKEDDIINHDLFNYIDFWVYTQIPSMTFKTQYKTAVFRKYLNIYFKTYRNLIYEFARNGYYRDMSDSQLKKALLHLITDIVRNMEMEMRKIGIPEIIIDKMNNVLNNQTLLTVDLINNICDNLFYVTDENSLKMYSFLNIVHPILNNTIDNVAEVCNNLNGDLSGLSMDGFTEPDGHDDE